MQMQPRHMQPRHTRRQLLRLIAPAIVPATLAVGCGRGRGTKHQVNMKPDPVVEAKNMLEAYAGGQPLGSEQEIFADLIARVTAADAAKGAALKAFLDETLAKGKVDTAKAKEVAAGL